MIIPTEADLEFEAEEHFSCDLSDLPQFVYAYGALCVAKNLYGFRIRCSALSTTLKAMRESNGPKGCFARKMTNSFMWFLWKEQYEMPPGYRPQLIPVSYTHLTLPTK